MPMSAASHGIATLKALIVFSVLAVLVADVWGRHHVCPPFSCGAFSNLSYPFRRQGDSAHCAPYELVCTANDTTIRIGSGTYHVRSINYTYSYFLVVETDWAMKSSCPLPLWDIHAPDDGRNNYGLCDITVNHSLEIDTYTLVYCLSTTNNFKISSVYHYNAWAIFVNCSQRIDDNTYSLVRCLSTTNSFIYVLISYYPYLASANKFKPSCGYLAMTPLGDAGMTVPWNASYKDVVKLMGQGFAIPFPYLEISYSAIVRDCLAFKINEMYKEPRNARGIIHQISDYIVIVLNFWQCLFSVLSYILSMPELICFIISHSVPLAIWSLQIMHVLLKFMVVPLAIFTFLAHKYWKTRITIDAVEKFLQMQQMLGGPLRYAYTDITAMTSHFREKLGQGGYGSVYKGVLFLGNVHVAIKMLSNSKCNGEEFISEVSTIGKIHHINVVRLVGFCSEEMRRALVYEYMPNGSLDKYIFSSEKSFSWDKLNDIALGIAKGINYMHHGCDMQILHFDIKPHNILLDQDFVPKVADFGLAKLFPRDRSFVPLSAMRGTIGYIAPEMVSRSFGTISSKSDVYSFGMLLLEMAGGRRNADPNIENSSQNYFPSWVYDRLFEQQVGEISAIIHMHELEKKLCIVGLWCIQMRSHDRPTMSEVIEMLESDVSGMEMPSRPFFCDGGEKIPMVDSCYLSSELDDIQEEDE